MKFVDHARRMGAERIFYEIAPSKAGYYSGNFSKWWGRYGRSIGFHDAKAVFHSFRHNFTDAMRQADLPDDVSRYLDGHVDKGKDTHLRYGKKPSVERLSKEISKVSYPGLQPVFNRLMEDE